MKALQTIMDQVARQLRELSATSRLLIGALAVILVMALFMVWLYGGRTSMVPLPVPLTGETRTEVITYLESRGVPWEERAGQIVVPAEKRHLVLAELTDREIIAPEQIDFNQLVQQESPFSSKTQNERRWLVATMNELSRTISRMKGIRRAVVVIDEPDRPAGLGAANRLPSASVTVETSGGALDQEQVNAIAAMVAGAQAELTTERVEVIDAGAGRRYRAEPPDALAAGRYLDLVREANRYYEEKILKSLGHIAGINVAVNVIVDHTETTERSRVVDEAKLGVKRESTESTNSTSPLPSGEPGVRSNAGATLGGAGRAATLARERTDTAMEPAFGGTDSQRRDPGGYPLKINASIGVPRSYFVRLFQQESAGGAAEPTAQEIDTLVTREVPRIRDHVQPLVDTGPKGGQAVGTVAVSMISDAGAGGGEGDGAAAPAAGGLLSESIVKYASLGGLALVSLLMMLLMVRRAAAGQQEARAEELSGAVDFTVGGGVLGEAAAGDVPLEAIEVDETSMRHQQMVEQINRMAAREPQEAARILRGWIGQADG